MRVDCEKRQVSFVSTLSSVSLTIHFQEDFSCQMPFASFHVEFKRIHWKTRKNFVELFIYRKKMLHQVMDGEKLTTYYYFRCIVCHECVCHGEFCWFSTSSFPSDWCWWRNYSFTIYKKKVHQHISTSQSVIAVYVRPRHIIRHKRW